MEKLIKFLKYHKIQPYNLSQSSIYYALCCKTIRISDHFGFESNALQFIKVDDSYIIIHGDNKPHLISLAKAKKILRSLIVAENYYSSTRLFNQIQTINQLKDKVTLMKEQMKSTILGYSSDKLKHKDLVEIKKIIARYYI